jgi:hypothetical protein
METGYIQIIQEEGSLTCRYTDKGIEKQTVYYNLEVLIFPSYRIASFEAHIFRQFVNSALREHLQKEEKKAEDRHFIRDTVAGYSVGKDLETSEFLPFTSFCTNYKERLFSRQR